MGYIGIPHTWSRSQPRLLKTEEISQQSGSGHARLQRLSTAVILILRMLASYVLFLMATSTGSLTVCASAPGILSATDVEMLSCSQPLNVWGYVDGDDTRTSISTTACSSTMTDDISISVSPTLIFPEVFSIETTSSVFTSNSSSSSVATTTRASPGSSLSAGGSSLSFLPPSSLPSSEPASSITPAPTLPQPSLPPSTTPGSDTPTHKSAAVVPLAVGVSVGGAFLTLAGIAAAVLWRRRRMRSGSSGSSNNGSLARAESPPPRDMPDDLSPLAPGVLFRGGSLHNRHSSEDGRRGGDGADGGAAVAATTAVTAASRHYRSNSLRQGSILNSLYPNDRFTPDAVAMHDVPRTPPAGPDCPWRRPSTMQSTKPPEIPYDGRRFPPYYGIPAAELAGYSELPG